MNHAAINNTAVDGHCSVAQIERSQACGRGSGVLGWWQGAAFFMKVELQTLFSLADVRVKFFPSRSIRWIRDTFGAGEFGPVYRDAGGWMVSAQALESWQMRHSVGPAVMVQIEDLRRSAVA